MNKLPSTSVNKAGNLNDLIMGNNKISNITMRIPGMRCNKIAFNDENWSMFVKYNLDCEKAI